MDELVRELGGSLAGTDTDDGPGSVRTVEGLSIDSRLVEPGQLFAALRGGRDGHDFVPAARERGAGAALTERVVDDGPTIVVEDVPEALARLARLARNRIRGPVVGITGSVGKTTAKDLLAAALRTTYVTAASERSFNNELGVPLTLANAPASTEATVIEMGARGHGHIALLCSMAHPNVGLVTAVHAVHTELMGGLDDIARAKSELVESLPPDGLAVLNADDHRVAAMGGRTEAQVIGFGTSPEADVRAVQVDVDEELRARFRLESPWATLQVRLGARGVHNVHNALGAAAVALWAGVDPDAVAEGLAVPPESPLRMELHRCSGSRLVLNDSYNAGPSSVEAALLALGELPAQRRVAVLGPMAELGEREAADHARIAELAAELEVALVAVGTTLYGGVCDDGSVSVGTGCVRLELPALDGPGSAAATVEAIESEGLVGEGTAVLVKGSRVAGLEAVAHELIARWGDPGPG